MKITATTQSISKLSADAIVVGHYAESPLAGPTAEVDAACGGVLTRLVERKEITGKHAELTALLAPAGIAAGQVVVLGLGKKDEFGRGPAFRAAAAAAKHLAGKERQSVAFYVGSDWPADVLEAAVCGALVGCQGQDLYRKEKKRTPFGEILWAGASGNSLASGEILGESVNLTRRL